MQIGQIFQSTESRAYTQDGAKAVHTRTNEWEITECDDEFLAAVYVGTVSEANRPAFAGYPTDLTMLVSSYERRIKTGEIVEVS
jgi:hypothetical protein